MKWIIISITIVSESYLLLYYEKKVYMLFIKRICLNQSNTLKIYNIFSLTRPLLLKWKNWPDKRSGLSRGDDLVLFYNLSAFEIWPLVGGAFIKEAGPTVLSPTSLGAEVIRLECIWGIKQGQTFIYHIGVVMGVSIW